MSTLNFFDSASFCSDKPMSTTIGTTTCLPMAISAGSDQLEGICPIGSVTRTSTDCAAPGCRPVIFPFMSQDSRPW